MANQYETRFKEAVDEYHASDTDYKKHLLQYEVALLASELAVIGFLLQDSVTRKLIGGWFYKLTFTSSLITTFLSIVFTMLYKRNEALYTRQNMHAEFYQAMIDGIAINVLGNDLEPVKDARGEKLKHLKEVIRYAALMKKYFAISERLFAIGVSLAILFVLALLIRM